MLIIKVNMVLFVFIVLMLGKKEHSEKNISVQGAAIVEIRLN